jgi:hypothetical protein
MRKSKLRSLKLFAISLLACVAGGFPISHAEETDADSPAQFIYQNCADQSFGLVLENCSAISIDRNLATVVVRDMQETTNGDSLSGDFFWLESRAISIAIPKEGYADKKWWSHGTHIFVKLVKNKRYFIAASPLDVIAVLPGSAEAKKLDDTGYILDNAVMSFWYSPRTGVKAIAFPNKDLSGDAFFCMYRKCLFAIDDHDAKKKQSSIFPRFRRILSVFVAPRVLLWRFADLSFHEEPSVRMPDFHGRRIPSFRRIFPGARR